MLAKKRSRGPKPHNFRNKLLLNQWLVSLFGINPLDGHKLREEKVRPFHLLATPLRTLDWKGLNHDNLHHFYHELVSSNLSWNDLSKAQILLYEENIVRHTQAINERRHSRWCGSISNG